MKTILETRNLSIGYKNKTIAENLNLSLVKGVATALIGRNGVGKSTLIKTITGSLPAIMGEIKIKEKNIYSFPRKELAKELAIVSTDSHVAGGLRLEEMVGLGRIPHTGQFGKFSKIDKQTVLDAMNSVGILHKKDCFVSQLSDGERQKGMIARGLAQETDLLIMDEPFSYLDVAARLEMLDLINKLAAERCKAILYSTHEVTEALKMSPMIWMMHSSGIIGGSPSQLIDNGDINHLFDSPRVNFDPITKEFKII